MYIVFLPVELPATVKGFYIGLKMRGLMCDWTVLGEAELSRRACLESQPDAALVRPGCI